MAVDSHPQSVPEHLDGIFQRSKSHSICPSHLSGREAEILSLAILGHTDEQIAQGLGITTSTVNSYWVRIRGKLGLLSRTQIVTGVLTFEHQRQIRELEAEIERLKAQLPGCGESVYLQQKENMEPWHPSEETSFPSGS